jgi:hypothetical protein
VDGTCCPILDLGHVATLTVGQESRENSDQSPQWPLQAREQQSNLSAEEQLEAVGQVQRDVVSLGQLDNDVGSEVKEVHR